MSRIGKKLIQVPSDVEIQIENNRITVKGPLGKEELVLDSAISIVWQDRTIKLEVPNIQFDAKQGLYRSLIANMVTGVTKGFERKLELIGVGYRVQKEGDKLIFSLGYSHPIDVIPPKGISFEIEGNTKVSVKGTSKQIVGQVASNIRELRPPEPYKGKGVKYIEETIRRKAGKSVK